MIVFTNGETTSHSDSIFEWPVLRNWSGSCFHTWQDLLQQKPNRLYPKWTLNLRVSKRMFSKNAVPITGIRPGSYKNEYQHKFLYSICWVSIQSSRFIFETPCFYLTWPQWNQLKRNRSTFWENVTDELNTAGLSELNGFQSMNWIDYKTHNIKDTPYYMDGIIWFIHIIWAIWYISSNGSLWRIVKMI